MVKGGNTLFNEIFLIEPPVKRHSKGRSTTFDSERNKCLISRYYYFGLETGFRYDLLIKILSKQFWISEITVYNIIRANHDVLAGIRKEKPTRAELKKKWPHLSWELPDIKHYINS